MAGNKHLVVNLNIIPFRFSRYDSKRIKFYTVTKTRVCAFYLKVQLRSPFFSYRRDEKSEKQINKYWTELFDYFIIKFIDHYIVGKFVTLIIHIVKS